MGQVLLLAREFRDRGGRQVSFIYVLMDRNLEIHQSSTLPIRSCIEVFQQNNLELQPWQKVAQAVPRLNWPISWLEKCPKHPQNLDARSDRARCTYFIKSQTSTIFRTNCLSNCHYYCVASLVPLWSRLGSVET